MSGDANLGSSEYIDLDGLFALYPQPDETYRAEFGKKTAPREFSLRWKISPTDGQLAFALMFLIQDIDFLLSPAPVPAMRPGFLGSPSNIFEIHSAACRSQGHADLLAWILEKFRSALGTDMSELTSATTEAGAKKARARIEKTVSTTLDALCRKSRRKPHGSATTIDIKLESGEMRSVLLAWLVLQVAKQFVEKNRVLPSKGELRLEVEAQYPETKGLTTVKWSNVWRDAGLSSLPKARTWALELRKRGSRSITKKP